MLDDSAKFFWAGTTVGDATLAPYSDDEFSDFIRDILEYDRTTSGPISSPAAAYASCLQVTNPAGVTIRVLPGLAMVDGKLYQTDANVDNVVVAPGAGSNYYRIILRKDSFAQTVRVAMLGPNAVAPPAVTQTDGVTWEISLATVRITSAGVVTVTDTRVFVGSVVGYAGTATTVITTSLGSFVGGGERHVAGVVPPGSAMVGGLANQIAGGGSGLYNGVVAGNGNIIGASVVSSAIMGGLSNEISGVTEYCVILGGNSNLIDAVQYSGIFVGRDIEVTSPYSAGIAGQDNIVDGTHSVLLGGQTNTLNGTRSVILAGDNNTIDATTSFAVAAGANAGVALDRSLVLGGGYYTVNTERGTLQMIFVNVGRLVTHGSAAWSRLLIEPAGGGSGELVIPTDSAWAFDVMCVGTTQGCAKTFSFRTFGILENDGGTVSLLAVPTIVTVYDGDDVSFDMRVLADDGANSLAIEVSDSDGAGDIVRWGALVKIEQVKFST